MSRRSDFPKLPQRPAVDPATVVPGPPISPAVRLRTYDDSEWEAFIEEWVYSLAGRYDRVERLSGAGDMGRDVIAIRATGQWDNYQCKHYNHPLRPSDIWVELGKLLYYTRRGDYTPPQQYLFVAPQGAGTSLANLLNDRARLEKGLRENWHTHCRSRITSRETVELDASMDAHISGFDFSIFSYAPPLTIIDDHRKTPYFVARFGGDLPLRPELHDPPSEVQDAESVYVSALLGAYSDHSSREIRSVAALEAEPDLDALVEHFGDARREFYSAEALRSFTRDSLPPGEFDRLQWHVRDGVIDVARLPHEDAYRRVLAVVAAAKSIPLTAHALHSRIGPLDRGGVCHQLVNDRKLRWTP